MLKPGPVRTRTKSRCVVSFAYLAFEGYENELLSEINYRAPKEVVIRNGRLFLLDLDLNLVWAQLKLTKFDIIKIDSINDAAKKLKAENKKWAAYSFHMHRRTELIQEKVSRGKFKKIKFLEKLSNHDFGFWCLLEEKKMLKCPSTLNPFPIGKIEFVEETATPPSRAYLKLWETFTLHVKPPEKNHVVIDMGSCPGGWTWVLQTIGCKVISVDKAPLDPNILALPNIEFIKQDAFKLDPSKIKKPDWFFSDIICDPQDLLNLVKKWIKRYPDLRFICTLKYKGATDFVTTDAFLSIPGSRVFHLCHNKHEVTWIKDS